MHQIPLAQLPDEVWTFLADVSAEEPAMLCDERGAVRYAVLRLPNPITPREAWLKERSNPTTARVLTVINVADQGGGGSSPDREDKELLVDRPIDSYNVLR